MLSAAPRASLTLPSCSPNYPRASRIGWAHARHCPFLNYHQLSFSLNLFKFFVIVDDSFSRLTTRMIVHDSFSVSCFGYHWPDSGQKTCCRPLSSRKIHTFTSLSYGTPFSIRIFTRKKLGTSCSRDFARATAG